MLSKQVAETNISLTNSSTNSLIDNLIESLIDSLINGLSIQIKSNYYFMSIEVQKAMLSRIAWLFYVDDIDIKSF